MANYSQTDTTAGWQDYVTLGKPKVVLMMLLCVLVGMFLAVPTPLDIPLEVFVGAMAGIGLVATSAAAVNHIADIHIDARMARTRTRPLVLGRINVQQAVLFSAVTGLTGMTLLVTFTNPLTAFLNLVSWIGYGFVYTFLLKHRTPQNIVIGGLFGAAPPLFGWTAITNNIGGEGLILVMIIFAWTPPHFWALALDRKQDYQAARVPMLPVTHGEEYTKRFILLYTLLLVAISLLPFAIGMSGPTYLLGALLLGIRFLQLAVRLLRGYENSAAATFRYSINYLALLFGLLLLDHYLIADRPIEPFVLEQYL